jgi:acetylornithine deacetylase/succinyl-diaminopimelate desuccinylase-like protein
MTVDAAAAVHDIMVSEAYHRARAVLAAEHGRTVLDIIHLTEIPAPSFQEDVRGAAWMEMARGDGLTDIQRDAEGNITALRRGAGNGPLVCIAAHLDTVFPPGTELKVRQEGNRLFAPGIGDDTRGLAVLLALARALNTAGIVTRADILFVADVGEEGPGDLRGMRHLFIKSPYKDRISAFITLDSPDMERIATTGIGAKRYRVTFRGPGGHSFGAFGIVNPMYAMARAVDELGRMQVPESPRTTFSASVTGGGTSINSIPNEVWTDFDLRSESAEELAKLEFRFLAIVDAAVAAENQARSVAAGPITAETTLTGDRPAGQTDLNSDLVRIAHAAIAAHGFTPGFEASSTDANIPMSLGIPAVKIGTGGTGGRAHSLEEWIDVTPEPSIRGMAAGLTTLLALAGLA